MTDERYKKLPQWAQDEIRVLRVDAAHWKAQALAATGGESNTRLLDGVEERGLPPNAQIRFLLVDDHFDVVIREDFVDIHASGNLSVEPWAANVVHIRVIDG